MELGFRWFGDEDLIELDYIRQIPNVKQIISAIYDVAVGEVWTKEQIKRLKDKIEEKNFYFKTIESVPVHEEIKYGGVNRDKWISNYQETLRNLSEFGITTVCYNFMPIFDWTRTDLAFLHEDGSNALALSQKVLKELDPLDKSLSLPGWDSSYKHDELKDLFDHYKAVDEEALWSNLEYFLKAILPVAKEVGIRMAIHPDDPPYSIFGLPRIITSQESYERLFKIDGSIENGITFCTGSLSSKAGNDIYTMLENYLKMNKVHFVHARNVKLHSNGDFEETAHATNYGSIDMVRVMELLKKYDFKGCVRPDHGRMIFGESGRPGYGLYDRALGVMYLYGIWETLNK